jgi:hypothetical protein
MKKHALKDALKQFTGTTAYYKLFPRLLLTDGAKFLADNAESYWLFDVFASYLLTAIDGDQEPFTCLVLTKESDSALIQITDGNARLLAEQHIEFTDFALDTIKLYGCWDGSYWVVLLPSEY